MMICPNCRTRVSEDAVICDSCNHILDASFLGDGITNDKKAEKSGDRTKVKAVAPPVPTPAASPAVAAALDDTPRRSILATNTAPPESVNEALEELSGQFQRLPFAEKWAAGGALTFVVSLALPWRWTEADDTVIGLFAGAWPLGLLALFVALVPFIRRHPRVRPFKAPLLAGSLGASLITLLLSAFSLRASIAKEVIHIGGRTKEVWKAAPHIGLGIGLLAALVMLFMSLGAFAQREKLPDA